ncbi:unnamed protein product [Protopolystoma xenopodis]|uniref:Uncharacterized protein n=1 Tax=Protopolystoma xenopodis TaxID=117903 RepID=A0A3S5ABK8_9PLAT|nr:unnamed protein product [Protopolystoma xenopodis]
MTSYISKRFASIVTERRHRQHRVTMLHLFLSTPLHMAHLLTFTQFFNLVSSNLAKEGTAKSGFSAAYSSSPPVTGVACKAPDLHSAHLLRLSIDRYYTTNSLVNCLKSCCLRVFNSRPRLRHFRGFRADHIHADANYQDLPLPRLQTHDSVILLPTHIVSHSLSRVSGFSEPLLGKMFGLFSLQSPFLDFPLSFMSRSLAIFLPAVEQVSWVQASPF